LPPIEGRLKACAMHLPTAAGIATAVSSVHPRIFLVASSSEPSAASMMSPLPWPAGTPRLDCRFGTGDRVQFPECRGDREIRLAAAVDKLLVVPQFADYWATQAADLFTHCAMRWSLEKLRSSRARCKFLSSVFPVAQFHWGGGCQNPRDRREPHA
jgi:hypothetical protein